MQDSRLAVPAAKLRRQNVLDPKLGCSLQANENGASGPALAAAHDCAGDIRDVGHDSSGHIRDEPVATFSGCRVPLGGIRDRPAVFHGDTCCDAGVGIPLYCKPFAEAGKWKAETNRGNRDNGGPGSSRLLRLRDEAGVLRRVERRLKRNIETDLEFLLRPRQPGLSLDHSEMAHWFRPEPAKSAPFSVGGDSRYGIVPYT